jgi:hypothetical protein
LHWRREADCVGGTSSVDGGICRRNRFLCCPLGKVVDTRNWKGARDESLAQDYTWATGISLESADKPLLICSHRYFRHDTDYFPPARWSGKACQTGEPRFFHCMYIHIVDENESGRNSEACLFHSINPNSCYAAATRQKRWTKKRSQLVSCSPNASSGPRRNPDRSRPHSHRCDTVRENRPRFPRED